ncbi:hypothetical protein [Nonomuraea wenchangensis]|uniref:hypothetical protein n=1 Tax=Nonomuraea wenchangensis TaxID=568860 RepID=UPI0033E1679F
MADLVDVDLGEGERADSRREALGSLLGYGTGAGAALCHGLAVERCPPSWPVGVLALTAPAMVGSNAPLTMLGTTDPRSWSAADWISDVVPHLAYGITAYAAHRLLSTSVTPSQPRRSRPW